MPKKIVNLESKSVTIKHDNGTEQVLTLSDLSEAMVTRAALHGLSQKMGDSYAGAADEADPSAYAISQVDEVIRNLLAGDWRAASTGGGSRVPDLARALAKVTGKSLEEVVESLEDATDEEKAAFAKHPQVAAELAAIRAGKAAERAAKAAAKAAGAEVAPINL